MNGSHLIERMVFSFDLGDESLYKEFSDRMSRMSKDGLADAIDRVLDEHSADDIHFIIDRIEIDVGDVRMEDLQSVVKARVVNELSARLEAMRGGEGGVGFRTEDSRRRQEAMLEHFVMHGRLPWWAPAAGVRMKEVFRAVMAEKTPFAAALFDKASHNTAYLKRLLGLAEVDLLVRALSGSGIEAPPTTLEWSPGFIHEAVRLASPRFGREKAYEIVKYNLLADVMGRGSDSGSQRREPSLSTRLFRESPLSGLSDANRRFLEHTFRSLVSKHTAKGMGTPKEGVDADSRASQERLNARELLEGMRKTNRKGRKAAPSRGDMADDPMLSDLRSFLLSGRLDAFRFKSTTAEVNIVFRRLVGERLGELTELVVSLGKSLRVRQRLLDNVSSKNIRRFFTEVMPGKKDLLAWLDSVYLETQEKVRPINQTNIRVQKSVDEVTLEILTTTNINALGNEAFLRMHLKRMALKHNIRYRDLLQAILGAIGKSRRQASNRFFAILKALHSELFPDLPGSGSAWQEKGLTEPPSNATEAAEGGASALYGTSTSDADRESAEGGSADGASAPVSEEGRKLRYFLRYEGKSRKFRPWVEDASLEKWLTPSEEGDAPVKVDGVKDRDAASGEGAAMDSASKRAFEEGTQGAKIAKTEEAGVQSATYAAKPLDEVEQGGDEEYPPRDGRRPPPPMDLLYRLPKELVRRLIAVKRTMLFGKSVGPLQDLVTGYLRYVSEPLPYDEATIPDLLKRIADHLDVDVEFLRFALSRAETIPHGTSEETVDPPERSVPSEDLPAPETPGEASSKAGTAHAESEVEGLIRHLTKYRQHYSAYHVRILLKDALGARAMDRTLFHSIVRLLFERDADLVSRTVEDILSSASVVQDASKRSEVYRSFTTTVLDPSNAPFDMNRLMSEVRRSVGVDRKEPFVMPARLTDVRMYFSPVREEGGRRRGKGRSRRTRERDIIVFYNIIQLDVALEEAGVNFFDNILFSFELLLTRYRARFLEILRANAYNPELSQFFAYSDDSRLFEQIRPLLPRSRTDRVTQAFAAVTDAIHRLRWVDLPREEIRRFAYLDAYPLIFIEADSMPDPSEILIDVLHRASRSQLLQPEAVSDVSLETALQGMRRSLGAIRYRQIFPDPRSRSREALMAFMEEVRLVRDDISLAGSKNDAMRASRLVATVAEEGRFPEDHPFAGATSVEHLVYLQELIGEGEVLSRLVRSGYRPSVVSKVAEWLDRKQLMTALAHRFGVAVERFMPVVRGWLDKVSLPDVEERGLLTRLLLAPVPVKPSDRLAVFNRSFVHSAMRDRYLSLGEGLEILYGGRSASSDMRVGLSMENLIDGMRDGSHRWPEFYLSVLSSPTIGNAMAYRVVDTWVRYLSAHREGITTDALFRTVTDVYFRNSFWHQRSQRRMHQLMLEATGVLKGRKGSSARRTTLELLRVGVPADLLLEHAVAFVPEAVESVEEALRTRGVDAEDFPAPWAAGISSVIGPAELSRYLMVPHARSSKIPDLLRRWIEDRTWDDESAKRFLGQLPDGAAVRLVRLLSGAVDLERIVLRWTAFLTRSGLVRNASEAEALVHRAVFAGKLWMHNSREYIHADIFRRLDVGGLMKRSKTAVSMDTIRSSALPATLFRTALAKEPAAGRKDVEAILESWLSGIGGAEGDAVRLDDPMLRVNIKGFGRIDADVLVFLETGRVAGQPVTVTGSPEFRSLIERMRTSGISLFLDMPALHPGALNQLPSFFNRSEVVEHVFSVIAGKWAGRVPLGLLRAMEERFSAMPMSNESLLQFAGIYRRYFRRGAASTFSDADGFLMEALRIAEFEAAAKSAARAALLPGARTAGSLFVRRLVEGMAAERKAIASGLWHLLERYLEKGVWPDGSRGIAEVELRAMVSSMMAKGDTRLRTLLFIRSATASSRRRLLKLLGPGAEKRLVDFIHPSLRARLVVFAVLMKRHFNLDAWRVVGGNGASEKLGLVLQWWSDARPRVTDPVEILRSFMEQLTDTLGVEDMAAVVKADLSRFSAVEKSLWMQLRASVPAMSDATPEKRRRLPSKKEAEKRAERMEPEADLDSGEGITVKNGGLVLLWPFLGRLFSRLQLADGKSFLGEREQARAIQLTEYLVTGKTEMEEYQLALNKVVCGAPLDLPVPSLLDLTPEEEDLCQKMLVGAIRNWEKMKNMRPKTFQETFLRREARLYRLEDRWELSVERKAYDVLLDTLPWNIAMFQLSWMPQRMVVHWK